MAPVDALALRVQFEAPRLHCQRAEENLDPSAVLVPADFFHDIGRKVQGILPLLAQFLGLARGFFGRLVLTHAAQDVGQVHVVPR